MTPCLRVFIESLFEGHCDPAELGATLPSEHALSSLPTRYFHSAVHPVDLRYQTTTFRGDAS